MAKTISNDEIESALSNCPDFESWPLDKVCMPIIAPSMLVINKSHLPKSSDQLRTVMFRKNYKLKVWELDKLKTA